MYMLTLGQSLGKHIQIWASTMYTYKVKRHYFCQSRKEISHATLGALLSSLTKTPKFSLAQASPFPLNVWDPTIVRGTLFTQTEVSGPEQTAPWHHLNVIQDLCETFYICGVITRVLGSLRCLKIFYGNWHELLTLPNVSQKVMRTTVLVMPQLEKEKVWRLLPSESYRQMRKLTSFRYWCWYSLEKWFILPLHWKGNLA